MPSNIPDANFQSFGSLSGPAEFIAAVESYSEKFVYVSPTSSQSLFTFIDSLPMDSDTLSCVC